jgi:hypothetical protein
LEIGDVSGTLQNPSVLRLKAVNNIEFYTQSNQRVLIDSSGNVYIAQKLGVKNSTPYYDIDVNGSIKANDDIIANRFLVAAGYWGDLNINSGSIRQSGYDLNVGTATANNLKFITDNLERVVIDASGKVGIGTSSPLTKLHVVGYPGVIIEANYGQILDIKSGSGYQVGLRFYNVGTHYTMGLDGISGKFVLGRGFNWPSLIAQDFVLLNGNIGIGTTTPTAKLHIQGATGYNQLRLATSYTPTSTSDANGDVGCIAWDDNYLYIKVSTGWKRVALSSF